MPRWPQARAGRNEAQSADTRGGIAPPRSNDALRSAPLTQGGFACSTQDTTHCANPPAATPTRCGSIGYGNNPAEAAPLVAALPAAAPPSPRHCRLRQASCFSAAGCDTPRSLTTLLRPTREASRYVDVIYAGPTSSSHSNTTATPSIRTQASFTLIQAEDQPWKRQGFMLSPSRKTRFSAGANYLTLQQ